MKVLYVSACMRAYTVLCALNMDTFHASPHNQTDILLSIISDIIYCTKYYFICSSFYYNSLSLSLLTEGKAIQKRAAQLLDNGSFFLSTSIHCVALIQHTHSISCINGCRSTIVSLFFCSLKIQKR